MSRGGKEGWGMNKLIGANLIVLAARLPLLHVRFQLLELPSQLQQGAVLEPRCRLEVTSALGLVDGVPRALDLLLDRGKPLDGGALTLDPRGALAVERMHCMIQALQMDEEFGPGASWVKPRLIVRKSSVRG